MPFRRDACVYVVDDDNGVRNSTMVLLKAADISARGYASGSAFLKNLDSSANGCILLDLHMPGLSGYQVLDILREDGNNIPVVLFSGRADSTTEEFAMRSGAAALLPKPAPPAQLIELVRRLLADGGAPAGA